MWLSFDLGVGQRMFSFFDVLLFSPMVLGRAFLITSKGGDYSSVSIFMGWIFLIFNAERKDVKSATVTTNTTVITSHIGLLVKSHFSIPQKARQLTIKGSIR